MICPVGANGIRPIDNLLVNKNLGDRPVAPTPFSSTSNVELFVRFDYLVLRIFRLLVTDKTPLTLRAAI